MDEKRVEEIRETTEFVRREREEAERRNELQRRFALAEAANKSLADRYGEANYHARLMVPRLSFDLGGRGSTNRIKFVLAYKGDRRTTLDGEVFVDGELQSSWTFDTSQALSLADWLIETFRAPSSPSTDQA